MISQEPELGPGLLESLWRFRWPVIVATALGALLGFLYAMQQPVMYRASARLLLEDPRSRIVLSDSNDYFIDSSRYVRNQAQVVTSAAVLRSAAESLEVAPGSLGVSAEPLLDIDAIDVSGVDSDPERAAAVVDAVGAAYETVTGQETRDAGDAAIEELEQARQEVEEQLSLIENSQQLDADDPVLAAEREAATEQLQTLVTRIRQLSVDTALAGSGVKLREQAFVPQQPYRPRPLRTAGATAMLALIAASAVGWWWNTRHPPLGQREDVDAVLRAPRLGEIPPFGPAATATPAADAPRSPAAEAYQFLVGALGPALERAGARSLLVTSARPGEGKTVTALNVAIAAERAGRRVVLVDADERYRSLTTAAGSTVSVGLPQAAVEGVPLDWSLARTQIAGADDLRLTGMPKDRSSANPADFFRSAMFPAALDRLGQAFDLVVVDAPPLLAVAEASAIAATADAVLVVVDQKTPDELLAELRRRLDLVDAQVIGYVINRADMLLSPYSYGADYGGGGDPDPDPDPDPDRDRDAAENSPGTFDSWSAPASTSPS